MLLTPKGQARNYYSNVIEAAPSRFSADYKAWAKRADSYSFECGCGHTYTQVSLSSVEAHLNFAH